MWAFLGFSFIIMSQIVLRDLSAMALSGYYGAGFDALK